MLLLHWKVLNPFSRGCEAERTGYILSCKNQFYFIFCYEKSCEDSQITSDQFISVLVV